MIGSRLDRRQSTRRHAQANVYLTCPGEPVRRCKINNLSASGIFIESGSLQLPEGSMVDLIFPITRGSVIKILRRRASVAHVTRSGAGMVLRKYSA